MLQTATGKPGDAPTSLTGQPSACGTVREVGTLAHALPGGRLVANAVASIPLWMEEVAAAFAGRPLDDPTVEEIWVNDPSLVFVARSGRHELTSTILSRAQVAEDRDVVPQRTDTGRARLIDEPAQLIDLPVTLCAGAEEYMRGFVLERAAGPEGHQRHVELDAE